MKKLALACLAFQIGVESLVLGQTAFRNLDFEMAEIVPWVGEPGPPGTAVVASNAIPGWTAAAYGTPNAWVYYDTITLGSAMISIQDRGNGGFPPILEGDYSLFLEPDFFGVVFPSVYQSGLVPKWARSLRFYTASTAADFDVTLEGQAVDTVWLGRKDSIRVWGVDVSSLADRVVELRFTGGGVLDSIQFSDLPVPVPMTISVSLSNTLVLSWPAPTNWFKVQRALDVTGTNWTAVTDAPVPAGSGSQLTVPAPTEPTFFRLISR